jgi:4-carboxymuconolactone decarboxylase
MKMRSEFRGDQFEKGLKVRREVLGDRYVERSLAAADDISAPLQKLITEWCWGDIWSRPNLERRLRSVLNLGFTMALNRQSEFKLHLRGALNNGVTKDEVIEIILQGAIYCGAPAALDAMKWAQATFAELEEEKRAAYA